jgi:hypothetical protein
VTRAELERKWSRTARRASYLVRTNPASPEIDQLFARMDAVASRLPARWGLRPERKARRA